MKVTTKTVSDRITLLENQKTLSINEENTLKMLRWGMEQYHRAEAAEAKLAEVEQQKAQWVTWAKEGCAEADRLKAKLEELEKQEGRLVFTCTGCEHSVFDEHPSCCDCGQGDGYTMSKVFTRPAPAINLAELLPVSIQPEYEVIKRILPTANPDEYACCVGADMWNACLAATLRNIEESQLDAKRTAFIQSLADETAPQQFQTLAPAQKGHLKYKFDRDWFAVSEVREISTHYIATLDEDGMSRNYDKQLYDFRPAGDQ